MRERGEALRVVEDAARRAGRGAAPKRGRERQFQAYVRDFARCWSASSPSCAHWTASGRMIAERSAPCGRGRKPFPTPRSSWAPGSGGSRTRGGGDADPYGEIPGFPLSTVESHAGELLVGTLADAGGGDAGRFHVYEATRHSKSDSRAGARRLARGRCWSPMRAAACTPVESGRSHADRGSHQPAGRESLVGRTTTGSAPGSRICRRRMTRPPRIGARVALERASPARRV